MKKLGMIFAMLLLFGCASSPVLIDAGIGGVAGLMYGASQNSTRKAISACMIGMGAGAGFGLTTQLTVERGVERGAEAVKNMFFPFVH